MADRVTRWARPDGAPLVTVLGASGFIGRAVVADLTLRGYRVRAVGRRRARLPEAGSATEPVVADLTGPGSVAPVVAGSDAVLVLTAHRSGPGSWRTAQVDPVAERVVVGIVRDVVAALAADAGPAGRGTAAEPRWLLLAGAAPPDDPAAAAQDPYFRLKAAAESEVRAAARAGRLAGGTLRLPTVYGRGAPVTDGAPAVDDLGVVTAMARRALAGEPLPLWFPVHRSLVHVLDAARAFGRALDAGRAGSAVSGRSWAVGADRPVRLDELFTRIAAGAAHHTGGRPVPVVRTVPPAHATAADRADVVVDDRAFRALTGWRPRIDLEPGLRDLIGALAASRARATGARGIRASDHPNEPARPPRPNWEAAS